MSARLIEQWHEAFGSLPKPNAVNCAYLVVEALNHGPRSKDYGADEIANAMLAFKRIGVEDAPKQTIYVDNDMVVKFVAFFMTRGWWHDLMYHDERRWAISLAPTNQLREFLPTALRGKFSVTP